MSEVPGFVVAELDQDTARIADLVEQIRGHRDGCAYPDYCVGAAWDVLADLTRSESNRLLRAALLRLAKPPQPHAWT